MQDLRTQLDTAATSLPDHELLVVLRSTQLALKVELQKLHSAKRGLGEEPTARKLDAELDEADGEEAASECGSHDVDAPLMLQDQGELDEEEQEEEEEEPEEPAPLLVTHEEDAVRRYARTLARARQLGTDRAAHARGRPARTAPTPAPTTSGTRRRWTRPSPRAVGVPRGSPTAGRR